MPLRLSIFRECSELRIPHLKARVDTAVVKTGISSQALQDAAEMQKDVVLLEATAFKDNLQKRPFSPFDGARARDLGLEKRSLKSCC